MTGCKENARGDVAKSPACLPPSHGCVACLALPRKLHSRSPDYSTRIAFTRAPHDALALLNPALPPLITHYPHSRASFLSPDKQSFLPTQGEYLDLAVEDSTHQTHNSARLLRIPRQPRYQHRSARE